MDLRALSSVSLVGGLLCAACITSAPSTNGGAAGATQPSTAKAGHAVAWPNGAHAAVSLTYDDAIQSQIENAVPALAKHHLVATFFLTGVSPYLQANADVYKGLVTAGHELGSHTMNHPCDRAQPWVQPGMGLQDYDLTRMQKELTDNVQQLRDLGQKEPFSFAYPCGSTWIGEKHESYVSLIEPLFVAARGVRPAVADPSSEDLTNVPSAMGNSSGADLVSWVERAVAQNGWITFTFHGVAGDYLPVNAEAHETLLAYLEAHKATVWTERFGRVASYVKTKRTAP